MPPPSFSWRRLLCLRWNVIMWSKRAGALPPWNEKKGGTKSGSLCLEKRKEMKLVSSFSPPLFVCVSTYSDIYRWILPGCGALAGGAAVVGRRGSWSFDLGTLRKPHRGGFAAWPWFDVSVRFGVYVCLYVHVCFRVRVFADNKEPLTGPTKLHRFNSWWRWCATKNGVY